MHALIRLSSGSNHDSLLQLLLQIAHRTISHTTTQRYYSLHADHAILEHIYSQKEVLRQLTVTVRPEVLLTLSRWYGRGITKSREGEAKKRPSLSSRSSGRRSKLARRPRGESSGEGPNPPTGINPQNRTGNQLNLPVRRPPTGIGASPPHRSGRLFGSKSP
jgi:hypothetical protein